MKKNTKTINKKLALATITMGVALSGTASPLLGVNTAQAIEMSKQEQVLSLVESISPSLGSTVVSPDKNIEVQLNTASKEYKSIAHKIEKGKIGGYISDGKTVRNVTPDQIQFDERTGKITVKHDTLDRYTQYAFVLDLNASADNGSNSRDENKKSMDVVTSFDEVANTVTLLGKGTVVLPKNEPAYNVGDVVTVHEITNPGQTKTIVSKDLKDTLSTIFNTGSAIGDATKVVANVVDNSVRVTEDAILHVNVTDDYGNPATDATLTVVGKGTGNVKVASTFTAEETTLITNGTADVILSDDSANLVDVDYTVTDNKTGTIISEGSADIDFSPGQTAQVEVDVPSKIEVGQEYSVTVEAEDVFGNNVEDGTKFDVNTEIGTVSNETPTVDGEFSFDYTAPTQAGKGDVLIVGDDFEYVMEDGFVVVATAPAKVVATLPSTVEGGQDVPISGDLVDQYGNPIANQTVTIEGSLNGTFTTDENGHFSGVVTPGTTGTVSATVGGQVIPITNPNGTPITTVTVATATPASVTMVKPSYIESGNYTFVSGKLLDEDGNPIGNKTIVFSGALSGNITTKADGSYSGHLIANSTGSVNAKVDGVLVPVTTSTGSSLGTVTVTAGLASGAANSFGNFTISNPYTSSGGKTVISGTLFGSNGKALPNTTIYMNINGYGGEDFRTDSKGNFSYTTYLNSGNHSFEIWADTGYYSMASNTVSKYIR
jgi:hypothetical protein